MIKRPLLSLSLSRSTLISNAHSLSRWIDLEKLWVVVGMGEHGRGHWVWFTKLVKRILCHL